MKPKRRPRLIASAAPGTAGLVLLLPVVALAIVVGCASRQTARKPTPPAADNIADTRRLITASLQAIQPALRTMGQISALTNPCPPQLFEQLYREAHRLNVDSLQVRARAHAMEARGSAYFEQWHLNLARHADPKVRAAAGQRKQQLDQSFLKVEQSFQPVRDEFKPFVAGVRRLVNGLERNPASASAEATRDWIRLTTDKGRKVEAGLTNVLQELNFAAALLRSAKSTQSSASPFPRAQRPS